MSAGGFSGGFGAFEADVVFAAVNRARPGGTYFAVLVAAALAAASASAARRASSSSCSSCCLLRSISVAAALESDLLRCQGFDCAATAVVVVVGALLDDTFPVPPD